MSNRRLRAGYQGNVNRYDVLCDHCGNLGSGHARLRTARRCARRHRRGSLTFGQPSCRYATVILHYVVDHPERAHVLERL